MADPVRLGDVLALALQRRDALCHCGHPLSDHERGNACYRRVEIGWGFESVTTRCACRLYREAKRT